MWYKSIIAKISLLLLMGSFVLLSYMKWRPGKDVKVPVNEAKLFTQLLPLLTHEIRERWMTGDKEGNFPAQKFNCPYFPQSSVLNPRYFECNRHYLECFLAGLTGVKPEITVVANGLTYKFKAVEKDGSFTKVITRKKSSGEFTPNYSVEVEFQLLGALEKNVTLNLQDSCNRYYLPKRIYGSGTLKNEADLWDNFSQDYFLDRSYVTKRDVDEWLMIKGQEPRYPTTEWHEPADHMLRSEQIEYCAFRGGRLMESHLFDAAAQWPKENKDPQQLPDRTLYPWGSTLIPQALVAKGEKSWMGIDYIWGGQLESLNNLFHPYLNLKPSSSYFPAIHPFHQLGKRVHWDGEDFFHHGFHFGPTPNIMPPVRDIPEPAELKVAFRCYQEREGYE